MNRKLSLSAMLVVALSTGLWAADPWNRPSKDWTLQDTTRMLINSPWVRDARVPAPWIKGDTTIQYPMLMDCNGHIDRDAAPSMGGMSEFQSIVVFRVSWVSSRAYREAHARRAAICGEVEKDDVDSLVEQGATDEYVIHIESPDMTPFEGVDEATIQQNTTLTGKKSGGVTAPSSVQISKFGASHVMGIFLHFAKTGQDGKPIVAPGETELALSYKRDRTEIKVRFSPEKMKFGGDPGL